MKLSEDDDHTETVRQVRSNKKTTAVWKSPAFSCILFSGTIRKLPNHRFLRAICQEKFKDAWVWDLKRSI